MSSYAGREFIDALHIFSVDILVMTGWHYCSSYPCSLIPYNVHCSTQPPDGGRSKNFCGGYAEPGLAAYQQLIHPAT